jgi:hypothetical protein
VTTDGAVAAERERRLELWRQVQLARSRGAITSGLLKELGISKGQQGIYRDLEHTTPVSGDSYGVTLSVRHTGRTYADDLSDDSMLYHYPVTTRGGRDRNEVEATKNARRFGLPIFVNIGLENGRDVRAGWVEDWDDDSKVFLISFDDNLATVPAATPTEEPFEPIVQRTRKYSQTRRRENAPKFRFEVLKRYGAVCAVCDIRIPELIEAAHLVPWERGGVDDPRNGLPLCALHHRAFDARMFAIEPRSGQVQTAARFTRDDLKISRADLRHLEHQPHEDALRYGWEQFTIG